MIALIATRREFMKLAVAATAGMVLRPTGEDQVFEGVECPVPLEPGSNIFMQLLRSGDSILGPVLIYQLDVRGDSVQDSWPVSSAPSPPMIAKLVRPDRQIVLIRVSVQPGCDYRWQGTPGAEIMVPERGEVVFKCSSPTGVGAVCFKKLT